MKHPPAGIDLTCTIICNMPEPGIMDKSTSNQFLPPFALPAIFKLSHYQIFPRS